MRYLAKTLLLLLVLPVAAADSSFEMRHGDSLVQVELHQQFDRQAREELQQWLQPLASSLALAYGRWPRKHWAISVAPTSVTGNDPIPWAQVNRGEIDEVVFFTSSDPDAEALLKAWTGYHELAHLLLPYRGAGDQWFSEGLASYYQNLLQARAGIIDEQDMWQRLHDGFRRGQHDIGSNGQTLANVSDGMPRNGAFMRVYWSGAWYFLAADARLRQQSGGTIGLDQALANLNDCCAEEHLSVPEIVTKLDRLNRVVLFEPLYRQMLASTETPDHLPLFHSLGIRVQDEAVVLQELGPGAQLRTGIEQSPTL